ncbi:O-antigen ligase family protein [Clostridium folliculivorans]|uniref:O-antigen ligase family protein n=1 Tax=Clostridium folliculivorans TaxID=2886038 RepID=UPI0021C3B3E0|nr:O-antigen ligase family protein [Clostridium folliculivorans]GKU31662.1 hypothetical protein CFB3_37690 [Clostridium folliculivorans]
MVQLTVLSYILIPLTLYILYKDKEKIFYFMVFFSPFTASSVLNIDVGPLKYGLQLSYWFGVVWILVMGHKLYKKELKISRKVRKAIFTFLALWTCVLISLFMPIILPRIGVEVVVKSIKSWVGEVPLSFSSYNITQFMYFTFVIIIAIFSIIYCNTRKVIYNTLRVLLYSTQFTVLWGFVQLFTFALKIPYPSFIFNNTIGLNLWDQVEGNIKRINSVAAEPSMYALFLSIMIPIILILWISNTNIIHRRLMNILTVSTLIMAVLTTSTTAYVGLGSSVLLIIILLASPYYKRFREESFVKNVKVMMSIVGVILVIFIISAISITKVREFTGIIYTMIFNKLSTGSGMERKDALLGGLSVFIKSPIFGVGFGSNRTFDLFTTLLSTTGVLGFGTFIYMNISILKRGFLNFKNNINNEFSIISIALVISILSGLVCLFVSIPDIIFVFYWIVLALIVCITNIERI